MGLSLPFSALKRASVSKTFLVLEIGDDTVAAALWRVEKGLVNVQLVSDPVVWQEQAEGASGLPEAADAAIGELGAVAEKIDEVLLGLPESWTHEQKIIPERKQLLKQVREELALKFLGFVVTSEALLKYLCALEGAPVSAVVVRVAETNIKVAIINDGEMLQSQMVGRSGELAADLIEGLARMTEVTPAGRIILYSSQLSTEDLQEQSTLLQAYDWLSSGFFRRTPVVEALPRDVTPTAVCVAGGPEVAISQGIVVTPPVSPSASAAKSTGEKPPISAPLASEPKSVKIEPNKDAVAFGFSAMQLNNVSPPADVFSGADTAPVKGPAVHLPEEELLVDDAESEVEPEAEQLLSPSSPVHTRGFLARVIGGIKVTLRSLAFGRTLRAKHEADAVNKPPTKIFALLILLLILAAVGGGVYALYKIYTVDVIVVLQTQSVQKDMVLTLSSSVAQSQPQNLIVKVQQVEQSATDSMSGQTTGAKIVGDKAKGKISVYNRTPLEKTFPAKSVLAAAGGLKFTLDDAVTVPPASNGSDYTIVPGKASAAITAVEIGPESNLDSKIELSIASFDKSQFVATTDNALQGGASRQIQAVSQQDVDKLSAELSNKLQALVLQQLRAQAATGQTVIPVGKPVPKKVVSEPAVGTESKTLKVTLTVSVNGLMYGPDDLLPVARLALQSQLPDKAVLKPEATQLTVQDSSPSGKNQIQAHVQLRSESIPFLDPQAITQAIVGLTPTTAQGTIRGQGSVQSVQFQFQPSIAAIFGKLPTQTERIRVQVRVGGS